MNKKNRQRKGRISIIIRNIPLYLFFLIATVSLYSDSYYRRGRLHFSHKKYEKATESFKNALRIRPGNGNPLFYLGYINEKQGHRYKSIEYYRRAIRLRMDRELKEKTFWKIVLHYKYREDWTKLAIYCRKFLQFKKNKDVQKLLEKAEKNYDPVLGEIDLLLESGKKNVQKKEYNEAIIDFQKAIYLRAEHRTARWELAIVLMKTRNYIRAIKHFNYLIQLNPNLWHYHYKAGKCNFQLQNYDLALENFSRTRRLYTAPSNSFRHYINLSEGLVYLERGQFKSAVIRLAKSRRIRNSTLVNAYLSLASFGSGRYSDADRFSRLSGKKIIKYPQALMSRALVKLRRNKQDEAFRLLVLFQKKMEQDKDAFQSRYYRLGYLFLGKLAAIKGKENISLAAFSKISPGEISAEMFYNFMGLKKENNKLKHDYYFYYAMAMKKANRLDEAIELLRSIESFTDAKYGLAQSFALKFDSARALFYLKQSTVSKPSLWQKAKTEPAFIRLARRDPNFALFLNDQNRKSQARLPGS